jgi:hypothetical protein
MKRRREAFRELRVVGPGVAVASGLFANALAGGAAAWSDLAGFAPTIATAALAGWAADRIRNAALAGIFPHAPWWMEYLTRAPFWYMAGGVGAVLGILIAKKYGLLDIRDIPITAFFARGANIYAGIQTAVWLLTQGVLKRDAP